MLKNKKKEGLAMRAMLEVSTDYGYDIAIYEEDLEGKQWVVHLVEYPGQSDPLIEGREAAKA